MSCNRGNVKGKFAGLDQTWSKQSDLRMSSWDPYPELKGPDCWGNSSLENYKSIPIVPLTVTHCSAPGNNGCASCGVYAMQGSTYSQQGSNGPAARYTVANVEAYRGKNNIEKYSTNGPCQCSGNPYSNLGNTWVNQKKYNL